MDICIPSDWNPDLQATSRYNRLKKRNIAKVMILQYMHSGIYLAAPCDLKFSSTAVPVNIGNHKYYIWLKQMQVDAEIIRRSESTLIQDKEEVLAKIDCKFAEISERRRQKKERYKHKKSAERSMQNIIQERPTKAIAESRRQQNTGTVESKKSNELAARESVQDRYIDGYQILSMRTMRPENLKTRFIITNYSCDICFCCGKALLYFVNFVQLNKNDVARVPGKYCRNCDLFYGEQGNSLKSLCKRSEYFNRLSLNDEYMDLPHSKRVRNLLKLTSVSVCFHLLCKDTHEHRIIAIVSNKAEICRESDVFHYSDWLARYILYQVYKGYKRFRIADVEYFLLKFFRLDSEKTNISDPWEIERIVLRKGGGLYNGITQKDIELVDVLLYSPYSDCFKIASASYDQTNKMYYMDAIVFRNFIEKHGNPGIQLVAYKKGNSEYYTMRDESLLHAYGYKVGKNGLSEAERQCLLAEVIDLELMSPRSILNLLDLNITMHPSDIYEEARAHWKTDKDFVMDYKVNPERFIVGSIV